MLVNHFAQQPLDKDIFVASDANHHVTDGIDVAIVPYRDGHLVVFDCEGGNDPKAANHQAVPLLITLVGPKLLCTATNLLVSLLETLARILAGRELIDFKSSSSGSSSWFSFGGKWAAGGSDPTNLDEPLIPPSGMLPTNELLVLINKHSLQPFTRDDLEACLVPDASTPELNSAREMIKRCFPARAIATLPYDAQLRTLSRASDLTQRAWAAFVAAVVPSDPLSISNFQLDGPQLASLLRHAVEASAKGKVKLVSTLEQTMMASVIQPAVEKAKAQFERMLPAVEDPDFLQKDPTEPTLAEFLEQLSGVPVREAVQAQADTLRTHFGQRWSALSKQRSAEERVGAEAKKGKRWFWCCTLIVAALVLVTGGAALTWYMLCEVHPGGYAFCLDHGLPGAANKSQGVLGSYCNSLDGSGCTPHQLPMYVDQHYIPTLMLETTDANVQLDLHEITSEVTSVNYEHTASTYMDTVSRSFGIGGSGFLRGIAFSLGLGHSELIQNMGMSDKRSYYAEMSREYKVFSAELRSTGDGSNGTLPYKLRPAFAHAVRKLPDTPAVIRAADSLQLWFCFFDQWGTHYVKSVDFGGVLRLRTFIDVQASQDEQTKHSNWNVNLDATFREKAGLGFNFSSDAQRQQSNAFQRYAKHQYFYGIGGDQSMKHDYYAWLKTVRKNPAPISTNVRPLSDILPTTKDFKTAFAAYLSKCPSTAAGGVCNGLGDCTACDEDEPFCTCKAGSYLEDDGNCYLNCPSATSEPCSGNGNCDKGACLCAVTTDGFGYEGSDCSAKCGVHEYYVSDKYCWWPPDAPACMDIRDADANMQCFCQDYTHFPHDPDMRGTILGTKDNIDTYDYCGHSHACHETWVWDHCKTPTGVRCSYGSGQPCSTSVNTDIKVFHKKVGAVQMPRVGLVATNATKASINVSLNATHTVSPALMRAS